MLADFVAFVFGTARARRCSWFTKPAEGKDECSPDFITWVRSPEFYRSRAWQHCRYVALKRAGGRCECCGATPRSTILHCDHIRPRSRFPHLALEPGNVQVLCESCNMGKGQWDMTDWRQNPAVLRPQRPLL